MTQCELDAYTFPAGRSKQVVYIGTDYHIHELMYDDRKVWTHTDLTEYTSAPRAAFDVPVVIGYTGPYGQSKNVAYFSKEYHIHHLTFGRGRNWRHTDVMRATGAPRAGGSPDLVGFAWTAKDSKQIAYIDRHQHVNQLAVSPYRKWHHVDLSILTGAPLADTLIGGFEWPTRQAKQIIYFDTNIHIHELSRRPKKKWRHTDLTILTDTPPAIATRKEAAAYAGALGRSKNIAYVADEHTIIKLSITPGQAWQPIDIAALAGLNNTSAQFVVGGYVGPDGLSEHVVHYPTTDIYELETMDGLSWTHVNLTAAAGVPWNAASGPAIAGIIGYSWAEGNSNHVVYTAGEDLHVHELTASPFGSWSHIDLTTLTGAPPVVDLS